MAVGDRDRASGGAARAALSRCAAAAALLAAAPLRAGGAPVFDFLKPGDVTVKVRADGAQGFACATNLCSLTGTGALWMGPWREKEAKDGFGFAEIHWADAARRDGSAFDRLAFNATNLSADKRPLVFYLYDGRLRKRPGARFSCTLPPRATRAVVVPLDWTKLDADATNLQALAFVHCSPRSSALCLADFALLRPGEAPPAAPAPQAFGGTVDAYLARERRLDAARVAAEDEAERARLAAFRRQLDAARPRQAANLAAFRRRLAAGGADISQVVVAQASSMQQIRPRDTDFARLAPATGLAFRLARGEYESAQLAVAAPGDAPLTGVHVTAEGAAPLQVEVQTVGFVLAHAPLRHGLAVCEPCATNACGYVRRVHPTPLGWYADPILPFLRTVSVAPGDVQSFLVRVKAPEACAAGVYEGRLRVQADGGVERVVPLAVRVNAFAVGRTSALPLLVSFTPYVQPLSLSWTEEQAQRLRRDPGAPVNLWRRRRTEWSDFLGEYFLLPSTIYPARGDAIPDFDLLRRAAARGRVGPFVVAPWEMCHDEAAWRRLFLEPLKKRLAAARAAGLGAYAMTYGCDEVEAEHFPAVRRALALLKAEAPDVPVITTAVDPDLGVGSPLADVDVFCPLTTNWDAEKVAAARAAGRKVWWYVACGELPPRANFFVESPLSEGRLLMGAQALREKPDGFLYYAIAKWNKERPLVDGPFTSWSPHGIRHRNAKALDGDGVLAYCGPDGMPIATLRLENFRDGVEDYNYAKILSDIYARHADKGDAWAKEARRLLDVPLSVMESMVNFTDDPQAIYAWRDRMADLIEHAR